MKIKLSLSNLESRENPSGGPVDEVVVTPPEGPPAVDAAPPAANAGLTDGPVVFSEGHLFFVDENPVIYVGDDTGPQITNPDYLIGGDENDVIVSDEIHVINIQPVSPENDSVIIIGDE